LKKSNGADHKDSDMRLLRIGFQSEHYTTPTPAEETYEIQRVLGDCT